MESIHRFSKPVLRRPRAVVAFEGWNDACDAASGAAEYFLAQARVAEPFAVIDPEEFFDFQVRRPTVSIDDGGTRRLTWPTTKFFALPDPTDERDLVVVLGEEPSFRWKTFARQATQVLNETDVEEVVLLGAFIGQVAHTRPVPVVGAATDPDVIDRYGLARSSYEGPTGIIGVLQEACREVGLPAMSLWAATPHYLAANPNPKAALALASRACDILHLRCDMSRLREAADEFERRVADAVEASDDLSVYVADLEEDGDSVPSPADFDPT
ncbi:MAG: PAC2 family protein, partial [Actinobacteria bacterium]|nr:PAC2 family protein [Actinomycetota bacterium]NIS32255.1 PAC2 family protein [Actinomycetota bacterium]NIT96167.1 PAC2 family protein [Actinomycetota bacterium]NIV56325.1 PAC2 family protein [Actinomycetota bacterium]NIX21600.1 PAC2 family protein [Actinomycetota bacterium]